MASYPRTTLRFFLAHAPDSQVDDAVVTAEYGAGLAPPSGETRGKLILRIVQGGTGPRIAANRGITSPVDIIKPIKAPVRLGHAIDRVIYGDPLYLEVQYEATEGSLPLLWYGLSTLNCSLHLV